MNEQRGKRQPVIINCGSAFTESDNSELLDRHSRYGVAFREVCGNPSALLTVLVPGAHASAGSLLAEREALQVYSLGPRNNPFTIGLAAGRWARKRGLSPYWIAGTPFREALAAITARRLRNGPIQIQAHGNFGKLNLWKGPVSDRARWLVARLTFPRADSVRTVSPDQQKSLLSTFRLNPKISFVAPVPVNSIFFEPAPNSNPDDGIFRIGWFGRLHRERGFDEWIARVRLNVRDLRVVELHIIGDGPHRQQLQAQIEEAFPKIRAVWWGRLSDRSLVSALSGLDLLINSVRNETFGRSMVEALLCGVRVEAIDSPGARYLQDLLERIADQGAQEIKSDQSETWLAMHHTSQEARSVFSSAQRESVSLLVGTWE